MNCLLFVAAVIAVGILVLAIADAMSLTDADCDDGED